MLLAFFKNMYHKQVPFKHLDPRDTIYKEKDIRQYLQEVNVPLEEIMDRYHKYFLRMTYQKDYKPCMNFQYSETMGINPLINITKSVNCGLVAYHYRAGAVI